MFQMPFISSKNSWDVALRMTHNSIIFPDLTGKNLKCLCMAVCAEKLVQCDGITCSTFIDFSQSMVLCVIASSF